MKKILGILIVVIFALVTGSCMTTTDMFHDAQPNKIVQNSDGTTTFEFIFQGENYSDEITKIKLQEYLDSYTKSNGYASYTIVALSANVFYKASVLGAIGAGMATVGSEGNGGGAVQATQHPYVRVLAMVKFQ